MKENEGAEALLEDISDVIEFRPSGKGAQGKAEPEKADLDAGAEPTGEEAAAIKGGKPAGEEEPKGEDGKPEDSKPSDEEAEGTPKKPVEEPKGGKPKGEDEEKGEGEGPKLDEKDLVIERLTKQNEAFIKALGNLSAAKLPLTEEEEPGEGEAEPKDKVDKKVKPEKPVDKGLPLSVEDLNLLPEDEDKFDELLRNPKELNKVFNNLYKKAVEVGRTMALQEFPTIIERQVASMNDINQMIKDFYIENEDLAPVRPYVGIIASQIQTEHPEYTVSKLFDETERVVRESLGMKKASKKAKPTEEGGKKEEPSFASPPGARKPAGGKLTGIAKEIQDLITD